MQRISINYRGIHVIIFADVKTILWNLYRLYIVYIYERSITVRLVILILFHV